MKNIYKSKKGSPIFIPMYIIGGIFIVMIIVKVWPAVLIMGVLTLMLVHMYFNTYYTISGKLLQVKSGFIINKTIDIDSIKKITPTIDMSSAPALSTDRLEISYGGDKYVFISPEDKTGFIDRLKTVNGEIVVWNSGL